MSMRNVKWLNGLHFDSRVAKAVFNDSGQQVANIVVRRAEMLTLEWLAGARANQILSVASKLDRFLFPHVSPRVMRSIAARIVEIAPGALAVMPNLASHVASLGRAVRISKFLTPEALARITDALGREGYVAGGRQGAADE